MNVRQAINRLFEEGANAWTEGARAGMWTFPVDIAETAEELRVRAELPGMNRDDIKVEVAGNQLMISGERQRRAEARGTNWIRTERTEGSFCRTFSLGIPVKADQVKATYRDGILEVAVPKADEVKPKQIDITVN